MREQVLIGAPRAAVWNALTDAKMLVQWFCEHAEVDLEAGRYDFWGRFTPDAPGREAGQHEVLEVVPGELLRFGWRIRDVDSTVAITLSESDGETTVTVVHDPDADKATGVKDFWVLVLHHGLRGVCEFGARDAGRFDFTLPTVHQDRTEQWIDVDAPLEHVYGVLIADLEHRWWVTDGARGKVRCEPHRFATTPFGMDDYPYESVVTWTLEESGGRTRVTLVHSGFEPGEDGPDIYHSLGWTDSLNWLKFLSEVGPSWMDRHRRTLAATGSRRKWFPVEASE